MSKIALSPELLKSKIEQHFEVKGLKAELQISGSSQSGDKIHCICLISEYNEIRNFEFEINFNRNYEPLLTRFEGICSITELIGILSEFKTAIENI